MLVLITIDTEFWPSDPEWPNRLLSRSTSTIDDDYARCVLGRTSAGEFGLPLILRTLEQHSLHAVFFIESLSASAVGGRHLEQTVAMVRGHRQEVQLHVHTEWLSEICSGSLPATYRQNLGDFGLDDQIAIVRQARVNLELAGACELVALRAGNFGGNRNTPIAAVAAGLNLDMSFDWSRSASDRSTVTKNNLLAAGGSRCPIVPLSCVEDVPGHFRSAQLAALSFPELRQALTVAERAGSPHFVLLLHSFELVTKNAHEDARPHHINIKRFNQLCGFLAENRDRFTTAKCGDLDLQAAARITPVVPRTSALLMLLRMRQQLMSRWH